MTAITTPTHEPTAHAHRSMAKAARWVAIALAIGGASAVAWRFATAHPAPQIHYQTARVDRGPLAAKVTATGTVSALVTVSVGSQVSGRIETLGADFESQVKKGQVVATIEPSLFRAAVAQARASYVAAIATVDKVQTQSTLAAAQLDRAKRLASAS